MKQGNQGNIPDVKKSLEQGFKEMDLIRKGKLKGTTWKRFLEEIKQKQDKEDLSIIDKVVNENAKAWEGLT